MDRTAFTIRPADPEDAPVLLGLIRELAAYENLLPEVVATEERLRETLFCEPPCAEAMLAEVESEPVGFLLFFPNYSTFLGRAGIHLEDVFVKPSFRGRGIGKALLTRLAEIAVERGCGRVEWNVLDWNEPSIQFYHSLGAIPMAEWTTFRLTGDSLTKLATHSR